MAIDPKELRIGSHVKYEDRRCIVVGIADIMSALKGDVALKCDDEVMLNADLSLINPIPITEELLSEMGFRKEMFDSDWSMWAKDFDSFSISVGIQNSECKGVNIKDDNDEYAMGGWSYPCKYLHELESLYYHCTKQELINN